MKILIVNEYTAIRAGIDITVENDVSLLSEAGHEVREFSVRHGEFLELPLKKKLRILLASMLRKYMVKELQELINTFRPDVIHFHNIYNLLSYPIWKYIDKKGAKIIQHLQNYYPFCLNSFFFTKGDSCRSCFKNNSFAAGVLKGCYQNSLFKSLLVALNRVSPETYIQNSAKIDLFIAPSEYVKNEYIMAGIPKEKISVLRNVPEYLNQENDENNKLTPEDGYILFLGTVNKFKGADIFCEIASNMPEYKFVLSGSGPLLEVLKSKYPSVRNLIFTGYISGSEKNKILMGARLLIVPSIWEEPDPLVIYEAQSLGIPVAAFPKGGITESIDFSMGSFFLDSAEIEKITGQVRANIKNSKFASRSSDMGLRIVKKKSLHQDRLLTLLDYYNKPVE